VAPSDDRLGCSGPPAALTDENPPDGVLVTYAFREPPKQPVTLTFLDSNGSEIASFTSAADGDEADGKKDDKKPVVPVEAGINRFIWDMRYPEAKGIDGYFTAEGTLAGPQAPPGTYQVRLTVGNETQTQPFEICSDPRIPATQADLDAQFALLVRIRDTINETHDTIRTLRTIRAQAEEWEKRSEDEKINPAIGETVQAMKKRLEPIEEDLIQTKAKGRSDTLNFPVKLNSKLAGIYGAVSSADSAPTKQMVEVYESLAARAKTQRAAVQEIVGQEVVVLNRMIQDAHLPAITPPATEGNEK